MKIRLFDNRLQRLMSIIMNFLSKLVLHIVLIGLSVLIRTGALTGLYTRRPGYAPVGYVTADDVAVFGSLSEFVANGQAVEIDRLRDIIELTQLSERVGFFVDSDGDERLEDQGFSRGEVQKLMLAQALYFNSEILLFDEAFNHISRKQTATILRSLKERGVTVVMSTHRPEVQSLCDRMFLVESNAN